MSVRIRMKKMGRTHRPFFRICAIDRRSPRDGRVLEELGTYDPSVSDTDARAVLRADRIDYWLGVGAQPSDKCAVLIKKYGTSGTHLEAQKAALARLAMPQVIPDAEPAVKPPKSEEEETPTNEAAAADSDAGTESDAGSEAPAEQAAAEPTPEAASDSSDDSDAAAEEAKSE